MFEGITFTFEDDRFDYGEQRFVTLGLLAGVPVSIVHTENEHEIRIISFRKATRREAQILFAFSPALPARAGVAGALWTNGKFS